ncbi:hypothetical protein AAC387_Pa06g2280 [Persea americana]
MTTGEKEQGLLSSDSSACRFLFCCFNRGGRFVFIGVAASAATRRRKRGILSGSHCCERIRAVSYSSKKKRGSGLSSSDAGTAADVQASPESGVLLPDAWKLRCDGKGLELMDELIMETCSATEVLRCIHIGLLCVQQDRADRPSMSSIVKMLTSDPTTLPEPMNISGFFIRRTVSESNHFPDEAQICSANEVTISDLEPL